MTPAVVVDTISRVYPGPVHALSTLSFSVARGETLAVCGKSGSGKSTLLNLLAGFDRPSTGRLVIDGQHLDQLTGPAVDAFRNRALGFVHQHHRLLPDLSVLANVALPSRVLGTKTRLAEQLARDILDEVGLGHRLNAFPGSLSGGERQRVGLARALVNRPALLLADEPTGNLDPDSAQRVWSIMKTFVRERGAALVLVTHDRMLAQELDRTLWLGKGVALSTIAPSTVALVHDEQVSAA